MCIEYVTKLCIWYVMSYEKNVYNIKYIKLQIIIVNELKGLREKRYILHLERN